MVTLTPRCIMCKREVPIQAPQEAIDKFKAGAHIQVALPMLTADERELLLSGICGKCFDKIAESAEEE